MTTRRMMEDSEPVVMTAFNDKMKERTPLNQVMGKAADMLRIIQVLQRVVQRSCRRVSQLFCCPMNAVQWENITCCPAQKHHTPEDNTTQMAIRSPPSTILIVNISNSTLINCVIGNDTYPAAVAESQPLMQESKPQMHGKTRCSCSREQQGAAQTSASPLLCPPPSSAEPPSITIHSSHLNCVIIGDNNYMHTEQTLTETEEA